MQKKVSRTPRSESENHSNGIRGTQVYAFISRQVDHDVVVDTSSDNSVYVTSVYSTMEDGVYGVGEEIFVTVVFSAPVRVCLPRRPTHLRSFPVKGGESADSGFMGACMSQ